MKYPVEVIWNSTGPVILGVKYPSHFTPVLLLTDCGWIFVVYEKSPSSQKLSSGKLPKVVIPVKISPEGVAVAIPAGKFGFMLY